MENQERKMQADRLLYEFGLLKKLEEIGSAHTVGSYQMQMMAWNDLDIDIENDRMSLDRLYELSAFITRTFHPLWYEAKEQVNDDGKRVWFHGFETAVTGELWNIDLWFFDKQTISEAERYGGYIVQNTSPAQKRAITEIKKELIKRGLYSFEQYKSVDVYQAVMEKDVKDADAFLALFH